MKVANNVKWIKITTDIFDDEKVKLIDGMPDADTIIVIWFKLLTLAGKVNENGALFLNSKIAYTEEMLATIFNRKVSTVRLALETFESLLMIERGDYIQISNWEKHQNVIGLDDIREKNRIRQQRFRNKQQQKQLENDSVTLRNVTVTHLDIDKEEEIDKDIKTIYNNKELNNISLAQKTLSVKELFDMFWKVYPRKVGKDKCFKWFNLRKKKINEEFVNDLIIAIENQKNSKQWQDPQYIPHPYTWLNRGGWQDELTYEITPEQKIKNRWEEFLNGE